MKFISPIFFLVIAVGLFFGFIDPTFTKAKELREENQQFDEALNKSRELQAIRDELLSKLNTFSTADLNRLNRLVPDSVDNVRLVLDLDSIASKYNMRVRDVIITQTKPDGPGVGTIGPDTRPFDSVVLTFSTASSYENFLRFIADLEDSLRLVDIVSISFAEPEGDLFEFNVSIKTYWLK